MLVTIFLAKVAKTFGYFWGFLKNVFLKLKLPWLFFDIFVKIGLLSIQTSGHTDDSTGFSNMF